MPSVLSRLLLQFFFSKSRYRLFGTFTARMKQTPQKKTVLITLENWINNVIANISFVLLFIFSIECDRFFLFPNSNFLRDVLYTVYVFWNCFELFRIKYSVICVYCSIFQNKILYENHTTTMRFKLFFTRYDILSDTSWFQPISKILMFILFVIAGFNFLFHLKIDSTIVNPVRMGSMWASDWCESIFEDRWKNWRL